MAKTESRMPSHASVRKAAREAQEAMAAEREATAALSEPELTAAVKARAAVAADKGPAKPVGKCMVGDEPLVARHKVPPVEGSVREGATPTGTCPLCSTHAKLTTKGVMASHIVRSEAMGASKALTSASIEPTDTGVRVGDPGAGDVRRKADVDGALGLGTVPVKVKVRDENGKLKTRVVELPATEENLREALSQVYARTDALVRRRDEAREAGAMHKVEAVGKLMATHQAACDVLLRRLRALEDAEEVREGGGEPLTAPLAGAAVGGRDHGRSDGPALVQGRAEGAMTLGEWSARGEAMSSVAYGYRSATNAPAGRVRADAGALGAPVTRHDTGLKLCAEEQCAHLAHGKKGSGGFKTYAEYSAMSATQQRRYRAAVVKKVAKAERERAWSAKHAPRPMTGQPFGCKALVDAADGSSLHDTASVMGQAPGGNTGRMERIASRG